MVVGVVIGGRRVVIGCYVETFSFIMSLGWRSVWASSSALRAGALHSLWSGNDVCKTSAVVHGAIKGTSRMAMLVHVQIGTCTAAPCGVV